VTWSELRKEAGFARSVLARRPFDLLLQVTNRCNMKCSFCDFWPNGAAAEEELSLDELSRLAGELAELGTCVVSIEGGEPFVRPDLVEIVRAFARDHLPVLYTNGWYVTEENARALFDAGLTQVGVSIDYPDARHDAKRGWPGAAHRAWEAVDRLRAAAPHGGRQVHVMTVLMHDNAADIERLLQESARHEVGHVVTLLSRDGYRRGKGVDALPAPGIGRALLPLWERYPHWRFFREYLERLDDFLGQGDLPECQAGAQAFNVDHVGNVAVCIERIDEPVGNVRKASLRELHERLRGRRETVAGCQACWTACRGFGQHLSGGAAWSSWRDLASRMRSR
jgi:MoaA/NifB/PqqE/SkfB family radical SAM enzyme